MVGVDRQDGRADVDQPARAARLERVRRSRRDHEDLVTHPRHRLELAGSFILTTRVGASLADFENRCGNGGGAASWWAERGVDLEGQAWR